MTKRTRPTRRPRFKPMPTLKLLWMLRTNSRRRHSAIAARIRGGLISEHEDLVVEILARLPIKSLMRFRCVSHGWRELISDPHFVKKHTRRQSERGVTDSDIRILFPTLPPKSLGLDSVMNLKDEDFPLIRSGRSLVITREHEFPVRFPRPDSEVPYVGSCNGLICIEAGYRDFVLWNPCTGSYNLLPRVPNGPRFPTVPCYYGFGYDSLSDDYKVVLGSHREWELEIRQMVEPMIQVYSLKNGLWKIHPGLDVMKTDHFRTELRGHGTLLDGVLHWLEFDYLNRYTSSEIRPFSLAEEKFQEPISIPYAEIGLVVGGIGGIDGLFVHRNCLCAHTHIHTSGLRIFMMKEYGVKESWTVLLKLTIDTVPQLYNDTSTPLFVFENGDFLGYNLGPGGPRLALYKQKDNVFKDLTRRFCLSRYISSIYKPMIYRETLVSPVTGSVAII